MANLKFRIMDGILFSVAETFHGLHLSDPGVSSFIASLNNLSHSFQHGVVTIRPHHEKYVIIVHSTS